MRLALVLQNLVANALKYRHPNRSPRIQVSAEREDRYWTVAVDDNGVGFEPGQAERIFRVFTRLHGSQMPGTGIGLALAKRIVDSHGGRIWAEGRPGQGATFRLSLPGHSAP